MTQLLRAGFGAPLYANEKYILEIGLGMYLCGHELGQK